MKFNDPTFVARYCFLAWLIHQSRGKRPASTSRVGSIFLILNTAWNFNATGIATAKPSPSITPSANLGSVTGAKKHSSSLCNKCVVKADLRLATWDKYPIIVDRIVVPYITRQENDSHVTSYSTQTLNISRSANHSYIT